MVHSNKDEAELQASRHKKTNFKKYSKVASTSMLAITMGMNWNSAISTAANNGADPSNLPIQQVSTAAPSNYTGNSLAYFQNEFLPKSSFHTLTFGETAPRAINVAIQGSAVVGQTLIGSYTFKDDENNPDSGSTFQWYRSDDAGQTNNYLPIPNATSNTYVIANGDVGKYITYVVTPRTNVAPKDGVATKSPATAAVAYAPAAPTATSVVITGTATVGQTLTGSYAYDDINRDPEIGSTFQWYRSDDAGQTLNYLPITNATSKTYVLANEDVGKYITYVVTPRTNVAPTDGVATKSQATAAVAPAPAAPAAPTATSVVITGTATVGQTLTGSYVYYDINSDLDIGSTFQWYRSDDAGQTINYLPITNATSSTYVLADEDFGKYITYVVTPRTNVAPTDGAATKSLPTAAVVYAPTAPTASSVVITGTAMVGQTLTGSYVYNDINNNPESGSTFQWYRSDDAEVTSEYTAIVNATGQTYVLTSADLGKHIKFEVVPKTEVEPKSGATIQSAPTATVAARPVSNVTVDVPKVTDPVTPAQEEETLIEVVAVKKGVETKESAKLILAKDKDGISLATFHIYTDGVVQSSQEANKKETIAVRAKTLKDAKTVYADIAGDAIETLTSNQQRLAILTGDVAIEFPAISLPVDDLVKQSGISADKLKVEIKIEKQPAIVKEQANEWASLQNAAVIGEPYKFSIFVNDGSASKPIVQYGNHYAYQTVPIPKGVENINSIGAVMLLDGKYVPVPVRIVDSEHALIQSPTNATVMLIQRNETFPDTAKHWGKDDIRLMADKDNVGGDKQGNYNPDVVVSRAEFAEILVRSFGLGHQYIGTGGLQFKDLPADAASQEKIRIAVGAGLFKGVSDGIFAPDQAVTREQMITVLMRFYKEFKLEVDSSAAGKLPPDFSDMSQLSSWAEADVNAANEAGIITGYEDDTIRALRTGTRAEVAALIRRFLHTTNLTN